MDNLTHTLTGIMLSRAGLNRFCPHATALLVLSSSAADLDVVSALRGSLSYLDCHRHVTHAVPFAPLIAVLPMLVVRSFARRPFPWFRSYLLSLAGVLAHALFDSANVYGVRLLLPFSDRWHGMDAVHIVDPWILLVLIIAVAWPALAGLIGSEIGARVRPGRGLAIFALSFIFLYGFARVLLHSRAVAVLDSHTYGGEAPRRVAAWPTMFNPFRWAGYAEGATFHSLHSVDLLGNFDPALGSVYYKPELTPAIRSAQQDAAVKSYLRFARYAMWRAIPAPNPEGATRIEIFDLRFGPPQDPRFLTTVLVDGQNRVLESKFSFGPLRFPLR